MSHFEMGGYLPLELQKGDSYFKEIPCEYVMEVNTGRTAMWCAINSLGVKKVRIPYFYCPDVIHAIEEIGVEVEFYRIGEDLMPLNIQDEADVAVVLVNYFGVISQKLLQYSKNFKKVVFDHAHSFYTPPLLEDGIMNVYSCRKFFGVSDGAYVIGKNLKKPTLEKDVSYSRSIHLLKCIEEGTNGAYLENKHNEEVVGERLLEMSTLTKNILSGVSYDQVAKRRNRNFRFLNERLKKIQQLDLTEMESIPYMYPLLLDYDIHKELVRNKVYVPVLWSQLLDEKWNDSLEQRYSANIVPLPLDQRYDEEQLEYMVQMIYEIVETYSNRKVNE